MNRNRLPFIVSIVMLVFSGSLLYSAYQIKNAYDEVLDRSMFHISYPSAYQHYILPTVDTFEKLYFPYLIVGLASLALALSILTVAVIKKFEERTPRNTEYWRKILVLALILCLYGASIALLKYKTWGVGILPGVVEVDAWFVFNGPDGYPIGNLLVSSPVDVTSDGKMVGESATAGTIWLIQLKSGRHVLSFGDYSEDYITPSNVTVLIQPFETTYIDIYYRTYWIPPSAYISLGQKFNWTWREVVSVQGHSFMYLGGLMYYPSRVTLDFARWQNHNWVETYCSSNFTPPLNWEKGTNLEQNLGLTPFSLHVYEFHRTYIVAQFFEG